MVSLASPPTTRWVAALSIGLVLYASTVQLLPGYTALYVPLNLAATALLGWVAWRAGLQRDDLGLEPALLRRGLAWGAAAAAAVGVALAIGVLVPPIRELFGDERVVGAGPGLLAYRALIRIPLGTALFEEFAFRGVLLGAWQRIASPQRAAWGSSVVFGLWHIRPTIELLDVNGIAGATAIRLSLVIAAVVATTLAGYLFCELRRRSGSLAAPFVAHAAINAMAIVIAAGVAG
jgi:membrane protease YdiL (CAAX protease family)